MVHFSTQIVRQVINRLRRFDLGFGGGIDGASLELDLRGLR